MDHPDNVAGSDDIAGDIPDELKHRSDGDPKTDVWASPTCQRCLSFFHPELAEPVPNEPQTPAIDLMENYVALHLSPANLATGLSQGCWWCSRLFFRLQRESVTASIEDFSQRYPKFYSAGLRLTELVYLLEYRLDDSQRGTMPFNRMEWRRSSREYLVDKKAFHLPPAGSPLPTFMYQLNEADRNTGLQRSMQFTSAQIDNCRRTHESCAQLSGSIWYPTRLLQILSAGDGSITSLRVVETRDDDAVSGPYATLSYCWGGRLGLRLLAGNYEEYGNTGIPAAKVPQLFLDAAFAALNFGASYIWIDVLCIIQDSTDDWLQECATMHLVYENGLCNIVAASAAHSGEPLFRTRDPRLIAPCIVRASDSRMISTYSEDTEFLEDSAWCRSFRLLPIYKRGWVLQERLLATRSIIFTQDQIYFQCTKGTTRDVFPQNTFQQLGLTRSTIGPRSFTYATCFQQWRDIVTAYGCTSLSFQKDTLIAVSGLAEKIRQLRPSRYLHGLWEADLVKGLAWTDAGQERRFEFSAPSWSWASVHRPYYVSDPDQREIPKAFATISDDKLQLRGPTFSISTDTSSSNYDSALIQKTINQRMDSLSVPGHVSILKLDGSDAENTERPMPRTLVGLPLLLIPREPMNSTSFLMALQLAGPQKVLMCTCLLLEPVAAAWGVYRRVGVFEIWGTDWLESANLGASNGSPSESQEGSEYHPEPLLKLCTRLPEDIYNHEYDEMTKAQTIFLV